MSTHTQDWRLQRPTAADVQAALAMSLGADQTAVIWPQLLAAADLESNDGHADGVQHVLEVMAVSADPMVRLCARSTRIRVIAYDALSSAHRVPAQH